MYVLTIMLHHSVVKHRHSVFCGFIYTYGFCKYWAANILHVWCILC